MINIDNQTSCYTLYVIPRLSYILCCITSYIVCDVSCLSYTQRAVSPLSYLLQVLALADRWCSGRRSCQTIIPNPELDIANQDCLEYLKLYFKATYHCIKGRLTD